MGSGTSQSRTDARRVGQARLIPFGLLELYDFYGNCSESTESVIIGQEEVAVGDDRRGKLNRIGSLEIELRSNFSGAVNYGAR